MYSEPLTYKQAISAPDANDWKAAMDLEMSKLRALHKQYNCLQGVWVDWIDIKVGRNRILCIHSAPKIISLYEIANVVGSKQYSQD